jgi:N-formylmaleamate deformylase
VTGWRTGNCETNGISLHYTRTGGKKPPVVLLHGLTASGVCWSAVTNALEGDYDVLMPDARGHGHSSAPEHGYRYEDHADDVIGFIEALQLSPAILVGHSMGGMVAAVVAGSHPELLRGLVLADPTFLSSEAQQEVRDSDVVDQHRRSLSMSLDNLIAEARARHPERSLDTIELIAQARLQTGMGAFDVLTPPNPAYRRVVSTIEVPTLLVTGGEGGVVSAPVAAQLQQLNPRLRVEQIPEAGHGLHYDQPERFTAIVKAFLVSIGA